PRRKRKAKKAAASSGMGLWLGIGGGVLALAVGIVVLVIVLKDNKGGTQGSGGLAGTASDKGKGESSEGPGTTAQVPVSQAKLSIKPAGGTEVQWATLTPDGKTAVCGVWGKKGVILWDIETNKPGPSLGRTSSGFAGAVSPDGKYLAVAD